MICKSTFCFLHKHPTIILSLIWLLGLFAGSLLAVACDFSGYFLLPDREYRANFIVRFFLMFMPFIASFLFFRIASNVPIYILAFLKACIFMFCTSYVLYALPENSWLLKSFIFFLDSVLVVCLIWLWIRMVSRQLKLKDFAIVLSIAVLAFVVDNCFVSPYFTSLFN